MNHSFGVSFSTLYARELSLNWLDCFNALHDDLGIRHYRLMSYWSIHEAERGTFDFSELDEQIAKCELTNSKVSLCLGLRQPRYPECHYPDWAISLSAEELEQEVVAYVEVVVNRYKSSPAIVSWQLENEALNRGIGENLEFSRKRLKREYSAVKAIDDRPVIMSTSNNYGLPVFGPIPDIVGFSLYRNQYSPRQKGVRHSKLTPGYYRLRAKIIESILRRPVIIHELQCEPWGREFTGNLSDDEQFESMSLEQMAHSIDFAKSTGIPHIDMWGAEWWYWRKVARQDDRFWNYVKANAIDEK